MNTPELPMGATPPPRTRARARTDDESVTLLALGVTTLWAAWVASQCVGWYLHGRADPDLHSTLVPRSELALIRMAAIATTAMALGSGVVHRTRPFAGVFVLIAFTVCAASTGVLYTPDHLVRWLIAWRATPAFASVARIAALVFLPVECGAALVVLRALGAARSIHMRPSTAHGSAGWGDATTLVRSTGVIVGRSPKGQLLRVALEGHAMTFAPTRSGKGISTVVPNLLTYPGSILVTDVKPELYAVTQRARAERGARVLALDPFHVAHAAQEHLATLNPFDLIDTDGPELIDDARLLADLMVLTEGREAGEQRFWNEEARSLLTGLCLHVATSAPRGARTLPYVRALLTLAPDAFAELLATMQASPHAGGLVARAADRLLQKAEKERSGVVSTAQSFTHFLDSPRIADALRSTTAQLSAVLEDFVAARATIYVVLPAERLESYAPWLRVVVGCVILRLMRAARVAAVRRSGDSWDRALLLLDEFAALGAMRPVERGIGLVAGLGAMFWLILQDVGQLQAIYPDRWRTLLANTALMQAFGTNDAETSEFLSKMTGDATVAVRSDNSSTGMSRGKHGQSQRGTGLTIGEAGRKLLLPDEVRRLPATRQLLFQGGRAPLLVNRVNYLTDREFRGLADANPLYPVAPPPAHPNGRASPSTVRGEDATRIDP